MIWILFLIPVLAIFYVVYLMLKAIVIIFIAIITSVLNRW